MGARGTINEQEKEGAPEVSSAWADPSRCALNGLQRLLCWNHLVHSSGSMCLTKQLTLYAFWI